MSLTFNGLNGLSFGDGTSQNTAASGFGFKNRIINGDMRIDQRNKGGSINTDNAQIFPVDRFFFLENAGTTCTTQQVSDAPAGFSNSFKFTNSSTTATPDYAQLVQRIEGYNVADLDFGKSTAKTVTLSFWVKSSLTGQFSVSLRNSDSNRSNVSTYTINAANTWEYKTITFVGDTSGTWLTTNGNGLELIYRIGGSGGTSSLNQWTATGDAFASGTVNVMGTSSATWQITGVQLEKGSTATDFDYRDIGRELQMCQRYTTIFYGGTYGSFMIYGSVFAFNIALPVSMRAQPTFSTNISDSNFVIGSASSSQWNMYIQNSGYNSYTGSINTLSMNSNPSTYNWVQLGTYGCTLGSSFTAFYLGSFLYFSFVAEL